MEDAEDEDATELDRNVGVEFIKLMNFHLGNTVVPVEGHNDASQQLQKTENSGYYTIPLLIQSFIICFPPMFQTLLI